MQSEVELFPKPGELALNKGDTLGLSGNSGSSMGPHLHFELRDTRSEQPLNPLKSPFESPDSLKPLLRRLALVGLSPEFGELSRIEIDLRKSPRDTLKMFSGLPAGGYGIEIDAIDKLSLSENANGLYRVVLIADNTERYLFVADRFSFEETRQIDGLINYPRKNATGVVWHRLYRLPGSSLSLSQSDARRGRLWLNPNDSAMCSIEMTDALGNISKMWLRLKSDSMAPDPQGVSIKDFIDPQRVEHISFGTHRASIPAQALYRRETRSIDTSASFPGTYGACAKILSAEIAIKKPIELDFDLSLIPEKYRDRATAVRFSSTGKPAALGGKVVSGRLKAESKELGAFGLRVDTLAPKVILKKSGTRTRLEDKKRLRFLVSDDFSGISRWDLYIDGHWEVLEYDAKNGWMDHRFETEPTNTNRNFRIVVSDRCGNKSTLEGVYRW